MIVLIRLQAVDVVSHGSIMHYGRAPGTQRTRLLPTASRLRDLRTADRRWLRLLKNVRGCGADQGVRLPVLPERQLAVRATAFGHANFSVPDSAAVRTSGIQALNAVAESGW
jgi:hypothetical protein